MRSALTSLALPLALLAISAHSVAQLAPNPCAPPAPTAEPQFPPTPSSSSAAPGSISGFVADTDGAAINGAIVTLTPTAPPTPRTATTTGDGAYSFTAVAPGPFSLAISASGFAPCMTSGTLHPGEDLNLAAIQLAAATTASVQVTASPAEVALAQVQTEEKQRVLGAFPNFFVSYDPDPLPLTSRRKFGMTFRNLVDPVSFALIGFQAGAEQVGNVYAWGRSPSAFGKRYAAAYGTFLDGNLLGDALLPSVFHQDPRYFYQGTGTTGSRIRHALLSAVICRGDDMRPQFNYSGILGSLAASGISNAYYPAANRSGAALTFEGVGVGIAGSAFTSLLQEFLIRRLTPHLPPR